MISESECISSLILLVPEFEIEWKENKIYGEDENRNIFGEISCFSDIFIENAANIEEKKLISIFNYVEELMKKGDSAVRGAIATCFLENLLNANSGGELNADKFVAFLGEKSRSHCRAWDEFTGVKTEGLW